MRRPADDAVVSRFQQLVVAGLRRDRVDLAAIFVTESAPNTFTRLPVREGEHLLVWFGTIRGGDVVSAERIRQATAALSSLADGPPELLQLDPTTRSLFGHHAYQ